MEFERSEISFAQAEGRAALPSQMALKTTTRVLRARLWDAVLQRVDAEMRKEGLRHTLGSRWERVYREFAIKKQGRFSDGVAKQKDAFVTSLRPYFEKDDYVAVLGTVEWLVRNAKDDTLSAAVASILEEERSAYRLVEGSIVPIASADEGKAFMGAVEALSQPGMSGAKTHLLKAGSALTAGQFSDSVRESIHSVESVARSLTGEGSLKEALAQLSKKHPLHPALKGGFNSIYGYTSDANGIRHPMVGDEATRVGEAEAVFMLGACASFVTFLSRIGSV